MNKSLRNILWAGVVWDLTGGIIFLVVHGILHKQLTPTIYPFYSIVIGLFLIMLAYIQLICSADIIRYCPNIGVVILLRVSFAISVLLYSILSELLPMQFILIAVVDSIFVGLLFLYATRGGMLTVSELFVAKKSQYQTLK